MGKEDLHVRVDTETMRPIREFADSHGISVAAVVGIVLRAGLHSLSRVIESEEK